MTVVPDFLEDSRIINNNGFIEESEIPNANAAIISNLSIKTTTTATGEKNENKKKTKNKKVGAFGFFRAALVALRPDDKKKPSSPKVDKWKKIVGSMRPLHLQDNKSPPPSPARSIMVENPNSEEDLMIQLHHTISPSPSSSSVDTMSQYASASNLQALDDCDNEDDDPDVVFDAICGDEMIDSKADEFIAQFYQQMKIDQHHRRGTIQQL